MRMTQAQLDHYHEKGWVVVKNVVDKATIDKIRQELADVHERFAATPPTHPRVGIAWEPKMPEGAPKRIWQLMGSEVVSPTLNDAITGDDMLDLVEQIIGPDITLYHSKLLMKAPHVGDSYFPWHQDYGYWHPMEKQPTQVNCALAIYPQTKANGCLHYVPGSHKQGLLQHTRSNNGGFDWGLGNDINQFPGVPVEYDAGDVCFFGSLVIHGSEANRTDAPATFNTAAYDISHNHRDPNRKENPVLRQAVAR